jgi:hypothetical protein
MTISTSGTKKIHRGSIISSLTRRVEIRVRSAFDISCKYHKTGPVVQIGENIVDADRPWKKTIM